MTKYQNQPHSHWSQNPFIKSVNRLQKSFSPKGTHVLCFFFPERVCGTWCCLSSPLRQDRVCGSSTVYTCSDSSALLFGLTRAFVLRAWPGLTSSFRSLAFAPDFNSGALYFYALSELHCHVIQSRIQHCL